MSNTTATEELLRHDRLIIGTGLAVICLLSWWYIVAGAGTGMSTIAMTTWQFPLPALMSHGAATWGLSYWVIMALMWWVMMIAMMVPSAAPMILLYTRVHRHAQEQGQMDRGVIPTAAFVSGYLLAWFVFSLAATALQWFLEQAGLVHSMMMWSTNSALSGSFLIAAGIYQLSSLKNICLKHCRSPADYLSRHWRKDRLGAARMGLEHGLYCVGCCWFLMALLFVGGIMNLVWIAGLAVFVLAEKLTRYGYWIARASGLLMIAVGGYLLVA
jgi:predicted metal-binding membrane protein